MSLCQKLYEISFGTPHISKTQKFTGSNNVRLSN